MFCFLNTRIFVPSIFFTSDTIGLWHNKAKSEDFQGRSKTPSNQAFKGVKFFTIFLIQIFWPQIFDSQEWHMQMPLAAIKYARFSFVEQGIQWKISTCLGSMLWRTKSNYTQKRQFLCSLRSVTWLVLLEGFK